MEDNSLRSRVFQSIRDDILKGKYSEKEELREATLGKELGVSRTPVREALRQLELEGLVEIVPNKGAYVTGISQKDVHDIYMIRSMLEGLCARWAAEHITPEQLEALEEVILLAEYHVEKGHSAQMTELDGKFHQILYDACESRILEHVLSDFHKYVQLTRRKSVRTEDRARKSIEEHREMLEAIRAKDVERAERLANVHIMHVMENLHMEQD
ncbi:GntR family transcriptional regulator [Bariatricus massiliensis]|uniref:GntR family transcriptional regulator n=1 Tax=Bariatricus massiliensis TaxID=1745713 RepID=A0ABS8DC92_9FIRM|nr:GntR family transcriptional regulator [Bariatricus massiliensis]MCB7303220.1 GntR family transcriptional regulator [Bariatricus massiliensis]MCB7373352.1 GntR family transcriptional regulator [Bariatricus massiliensis]MCB7386022.1 GntR family transcriptional regulator [Bariatricus massiliensis]MCB7410184.1 GntR family transcriptional regulator [Bariatricus massiliensis]MCQ5252532.1 GntR family transcriptional regulator [Bariatricus massiliensis]